MVTGCSSIPYSHVFTYYGAFFTYRFSENDAMPVFEPFQPCTLAREIEILRPILWLSWTQDGNFHTPCLFKSAEQGLFNIAC